MFDLVVFLPNRLVWPRYELRLSIGIAILHSILTIQSYSDIYDDLSYIEIEYRVISFSARYMAGVNIYELAMFVSELIFLAISWPFIDRNFKLFWSLRYKTQKKVQFMANIMANTDADAIALFVSQTLRLSLIFLKTLTARSIRVETSIRNENVNRKYSEQKLNPIYFLAHKWIRI